MSSSCFRPFSNKYNRHKGRGQYLCKVCQEPLFSSKAKYDSGSGWPSFYDVIDGSRITYKQDTSASELSWQLYKLIIRWTRLSKLAHTYVPVDMSVYNKAILYTGCNFLNLSNYLWKLMELGLYLLSHIQWARLQMNLPRKWGAESRVLNLRVAL